METAHCRVCYQPLTGMQTRCRQCGDVDRRRIARLISGEALKFGGAAVLVLAILAVFFLATRAG